MDQIDAELNTILHPDFASLANAVKDLSITQKTEDSSYINACHRHACPRKPTPHGERIERSRGFHSITIDTLFIESLSYCSKRSFIRSLKCEQDNHDLRTISI